MHAIHPEAQWFSGAGLGLFIHWGPYSVAGIEASWPIQPNRPQHIPVEAYEQLAGQFMPTHYEPREWARLARRAGASYVVLTTKHHDGYCLFETSTTDYAAHELGPGRDLVGPYVEACRAEGLKVGFYFSLVDWHDLDFATIPIATWIRSPKPFEHNPNRWNQFMVRMYTQIEELLTNYGRIDLFWFDVPGFGADRWHSHELKAMMLNLQPHLVINDRLPEAGDYATPEQYIPAKIPEGWWECCMTMNDQWAYHPNASSYKSTGRLIHTLAEVAGGGGNLLLNVGPQPDGRFPEPAIQRLNEMAEWMSHSAASVHNVSRGPRNGHFYGPITQHAQTIYLHVLDLPREGIDLRGIDILPTAATVLKTGEEIPMTTQDVGSGFYRIHIALTDQRCIPFDTVVALQFERPPRWAM